MSKTYSFFELKPEWLQEAKKVDPFEGIDGEALIRLFHELAERSRKHMALVVLDEVADPLTEQQWGELTLLVPTPTSALIRPIESPTE